MISRRNRRESRHPNDSQFSCLFFGQCQLVVRRPETVTRDGISLDEAVYSPGEMRLVVDTPDLPALRQHATDLGRELLDLWTEERNTLAKEVMQDIEAQRRKAKDR